MITQLTNVTEEVVATLSHIWFTSNIEAHDFIDEAYWLENKSAVEAALPSATLFVYSIDDTIVGFLGLMDTYIAGIFVLNAYRSHGIGTQLLAKAKAEQPQLTLAVYKKNAAALRFYLKNDFVIQKERLDAETDEWEAQMTWQA